MTFDTWIARLRARGFILCPASSAVPVELRAVLPGGVGVHFRCQGVRVRLRVYRPGRAAWQIPLRDTGWCPEESLELWVHQPVTGDAVPDRGRLVFPDEARPDDEIVLDGAREWGWRSYEAGLLRAAQAAPLFDLMLAGAGLLEHEPEQDTEPQLLPAARTANSQPQPRRPKQDPARRDTATAVAEAVSELMDPARVAHLVGAGAALGHGNGHGNRPPRENPPDTPLLLPGARRPDTNRTADRTH